MPTELCSRFVVFVVDLEPQESMTGEFGLSQPYRKIIHPCSLNPVSANVSKATTPPTTTHKLPS